MSEFTRKAAKTDYELLNTRKAIREKISDIDWQSVTDEMNENGYSLVSQFLHVLTQQIPRAQSKAIVLRPRKGDMLIITTNFRPVKGGQRLLPSPDVWSKRGARWRKTRSWNYFP